MYTLARTYLQSKLSKKKKRQEVIYKATQWQAKGKVFAEEKDISECSFALAALC